MNGGLSIPHACFRVLPDQSHMQRFHPHPNALFFNALHGVVIETHRLVFKHDTLDQRSHVKIRFPLPLLGNLSVESKARSRNYPEN